jgi:RHS repeat-associated protein
VSRTRGTGDFIYPGGPLLTTYAYDAADRVTGISDTYTDSEGDPATSLDGQSYIYNADSDVTAETNAEGMVSYTYDADQQLTGVSGASTATYSYDQNGNRTMSGYSTGTGNELTEGAGYTYTYDHDGNLISETQTSTGDVTTYTWDYRNRLTNVVEENSSHTVILQATYTYDVLNRRIETDETVSGTETKLYTVYDGTNPYAEFDGSGDLVERYVYGPGANQILARVSGSGTLAWYLADNEGSIRDIVSNSGTVIDHIAYDAYGNVISESDASDGDQFKFDGMAWDAAIGLYYDNARYYNPANGRFVSQDSIEFRGNDANLYRYTSNDPADNIDTNGEKKSRISIGNITSTDPGLLGVVTLTTPYTTIQGEITWPYTDYTPTTVTTTITGPTSATYTRWRFGRSPSNLDQNFFNPTLWTYYNTFPILFDPGSTVTFTTTVTGTYTGDPANGVNKPASVQITSEPKTVKF